MIHATDSKLMIHVTVSSLPMARLVCLHNGALIDKFVPHSLDIQSV